MGHFHAILKITRRKEQLSVLKLDGQGKDKRFEKGEGLQGKVISTCPFLPSWVPVPGSSLHQWMIPGPRLSGKIMKKDLDFLCFPDMQDRVLPAESQTVFFFSIISCQKREGHKQIFIYFEKDVLFYNILKERKQTSLANAFLKQRICFC